MVGVRLVPIRLVSRCRSAVSATVAIMRLPRRSMGFLELGLGTPFEVVEYGTLEWIDWFKDFRLLDPIGNVD